jgi:hypothetical protein
MLSSWRFYVDYRTLNRSLLGEGHTHRSFCSTVLVLAAALVMPYSIGAQGVSVPALDDRFVMPTVPVASASDTANHLFQAGSRSAHVRSGLRTGFAIGGALGALTGLLLVPRSRCGGATPDTGTRCSFAIQAYLVSWLAVQTGIGFASWGGIIGALRPVHHQR